MGSAPLCNASFLGEWLATKQDPEKEKSVRTGGGGARASAGGRARLRWRLLSRGNVFQNQQPTCGHCWALKF